jgi:probable phosphoglycerate mutase
MLVCDMTRTLPRVGLPQLWLVRHGETSWSAAGRHTGRTDLPLDEAGRDQALALRPALEQHDFAQVLTSPLQRAHETCQIAGYGDRAEAIGDLQEWDYGEYEGLTTEQIRRERPDWSLWRDGCPGGESASDVAARADRVIARAREAAGDAVVFSHGHLLRVLAARWVALDPTAGALFALSTATVSVLGWEREQAVVREWNVGSGALLRAGGTRRSCRPA